MLPEGNPIRSVRHMGELPRSHTERWTLLGQDGGQSIEVGDRTLFVFSDTLLSARSDSRPSHAVPAAFRSAVGSRGVFLANCAGMSNARSVREAWADIDYYRDSMQFPREILPATRREAAHEIRFWPEHGFYWNGAVYLYYIGIQTVDPSTLWGFRNVGCGVARLDPATGDCDRISLGGDWRLWRVGEDLHFGVQVLRVGEHCYVFGSVRNGLFNRAIVARASPDDLGNCGAYMFLASTEPEWATSVEESCDLGPCAGDFSVSYNDHLGRYLMLYIDPYEKILTMRTASEVWGPYSQPKPIVAVPHDSASEMVYLGFEHTTFTTDGGRTVFLSYSQPHFKNNSLVALKFR